MCQWLQVHDALLESFSSKPQDDYSINVPESSGNSNPIATSINPSADQMETLTVETPIPTVSSSVPTACFTDSQEPSSDTRLILKRVANQVETPSLDNILTLTNRFEDILRVTTNSDESNKVEADVSNIETTITASPTPTLRIHKDHSKSQIISHVDTPIQTTNKSKEVEEQSFIATIHQKTNPALLQFCLFSCFLSQVEPKKISDALQDPSWENPWGKDGTGKDVDLHHYRSMIGSLMYLTASRPDIMFAVCACARHQVTPIKSYSDSEYGGASQDHKSTTGGCQFLGRRLISWQYKKQTIVATATTKAEYVAAAKKSEKELEEEASRALKRKTESSEQQAAKKQKLDE
nr:putative ribonuclease H-like domain-containing protein [Tanacetum cinerariifolium]